jgi:Sap, sulfolipid-1-addressing protein
VILGEVLLGLLPLIVGAAVVPIWIIMVLFLLRSKGGLLEAAAFAAGAIIVRLAQGILFGYVFGKSAEASGDIGSSVILSTLLSVVGILMLITAFKQWRKEDDPDAPPPKWMATIGGLSAAKALGIGALLVAIAAKQWVFTLSAIGIIGQAQMSQAENVIAFLFYVLAASSLVLTPIVVYAVAPTQSAKTLDVAQGWLERHNQVIVIVIAISLIFGLLFLWKGIAGPVG